MKRILAIVLAFMMVLCLFAACGEKANTANPVPSASGQAQPGTSSSGTQGSTGGSGTTASAGGTSVTLNPEVTTNEYNYFWSDLREMEVHPSDKTMKFALNNTMVACTQLGHQSDGQCNIHNLFFQGLLQWDSINNRVGPCLATSYEWLDDTTIRLYLEKGVNSIDGDPFTASDVIWSYKFQKDSGLLNAYYSIFDFENSKAVDDYTVEFKLTKSYPFLPLDMCAAYFTVGVEKSAKAIGYNEATGEWDQVKLDWNPGYGTGPYKLVETDEISWLKAERRDNYWDKTLPYYKYFEVTAMTDTTARVMSVEAGDNMATEKINYSTGSSFKDNDEFTVWASACPGAVYNLFMNSAVEALKSKEVRQAIALGIDYQSLADVVFEGFADPSDSVMAPIASDHYVAPDGVEDYIRYDPELAKQKLKESGFADGVTLDLKYRSSDAPSGKIVEMLNNMLKEIGITIVVTPLEASVYAQVVKAGDYELACGVGANPNPKTNVDKIYSGISYGATTGWCNTVWYDGDQQYLTDLCDKCYYTVNDAARMEAWKELHELCREYVPFIMLVYQKDLAMSISDVVGMMRNSYGGINYAWLYEADYITG